MRGARREVRGAGRESANTLNYPKAKPHGPMPKGKVWDGASGHWVEGEGEGEEAEEGGDAKRAKKELSARGHIYM